MLEKTQKYVVDAVSPTARTKHEKFRERAVELNKQMNASVEFGEDFDKLFQNELRKLNKE